MLHEYIQKFSEEFAESKAKNELKKAAFTNKEWTELMLLIRDPEEYFYTVEQNRVKVSVILPVYNCENYLRQCLDSLVAQTLHEIEIICINDGSTDHSGDILTEYAAADGRFVVIHTENKGAGAARNAGLKIACGKYLSFLDSDDWFEPNMLSIAYQKAECDKADITIFRSAQYDNETGKETLCTYSVRLDMLPQYRTFSASDLDCSMFRSIMGWAWDKLYNRSFVLSNDLFFQEQRTTNDMYFTYISLYKASRITVCDQFLYHQRRNVGSSLSSTREQSWQCFYKALCEVKRELKEMGIWARYEPDFVDYSLHSCLWNLNTLSEKQGQELYQKLKQEWFENLGITAAPTKWFVYKDEYKQFCEIMGSDNDYLTFKLSRISFENSEMKKRLAEHAAITEAAVPLDVQEADFWRREVEAIRNSMSFRIGKKITWVLRKIFRK